MKSLSRSLIRVKFTVAGRSSGSYAVPVKICPASLKLDCGSLPSPLIYCLENSDQRVNILHRHLSKTPSFVWWGVSGYAQTCPSHNKTIACLFWSLCAVALWSCGSLSRLPLTGYAFTVWQRWPISQGGDYTPATKNLFRHSPYCEPVGKKAMMHLIMKSILNEALLACKQHRLPT